MQKTNKEKDIKSKTIEFTEIERYTFLGGFFKRFVNKYKEPFEDMLFREYWEKERLLNKDLCASVRGNIYRIYYGSWYFKKSKEDSSLRYFTVKGLDLKADAVKTCLGIMQRKQTKDKFEADLTSSLSASSNGLSLGHVSTVLQMEHSVSFAESAEMIEALRNEEGYIFFTRSYGKTKYEIEYLKLKKEPIDLKTKVSPDQKMRRKLLLKKNT